jgi:predicted nucleic acid-binding protein
MLYRLLSGLPPHVGNDTRMVVLAAARNHIERIPGGGELQSIALRAMANEPEHRHQSVQDFQRDIRRFQEHHASIELGRLAGADLERAQSGGRYEDFAQAVSSFREALRLWDGNAVAQVGLESAQLAYARVALQRGDLDLADSLLASQTQEHQKLRANVTHERRQREQRHRRQRLLRITAQALAAALLLSIAGGAMLSSHQERRAHQAEVERDAEKLHALEAEVTASQVAAEAAAKVKRRSQAFVPYAQAMDRLMRGEGHYAEAAEGMRTAIGLDPLFSEAHFALGEALRLGGEPVASEVAYLRADAIDRQEAHQPNIRALLMAGFADLDAFENQRARDLFAQADQLGHDDPLALTCRALVHALDGRLDQARTLAQQAVSQAPLLWETHAALGCISWGLYAEGVADPTTIIPTALAALRQALQLSPNQPVVRVFLARALARSQRPEDKEPLANLIRGPGRGLVLHPSLRIEHAVALIETGAVDEAERELNQAEKDGAPPTALRFGRIGIAKARGNWESCYSQLTSLVHDQESVAILVGNWVRLGLRFPEHRKEVTDFFTGWRQRHPDYPSCSLIAAQIALDANDLPRAQSELAQALKATPYRVELLLLQVDLLRRSGKHAEALALLKPVVAARPQDFELRLIELETIAKSGDVVQAVERLDALEKDFPARAADIARLKAKLMR